MKLLSLILALLFSGPVAALAHEIRPASLEIVRQHDTCMVKWKQPESGTTKLDLAPNFSDGWLDSAPRSKRHALTYSMTTWTRSNCTSEVLQRQTVKVAGLDNTITDVLIRVDYGNGKLRQIIMRPGDKPVSLNMPDHIAPPALSFFFLGVEHILTGFDHLAFVLALILLVGFRRQLAIAVSGFTFAHSITLGATALGVFHPWPAFIECMVALSIVFVAAEVLRVRKGDRTLLSRWPLLASAGFGLLHGFAFAGPLAEIGLPKGEELLALLLFNLGVEIGQLLFIGFMLTAVVTSAKMSPEVSSTASRLAPYVIGTTAAFWFCERIVQLFHGTT